MGLRRVAAMLALAGCASGGVGGMAKEESDLRAILWDAATGCARNSSTITITDVDSFGRVHYSLWQGGKQDVPDWERCYQAKTGEELAKRPELAKYYREKMAR